MLNVSVLDHLVLTTNNIEAAAEFYQRVLGMEIVEFNEGRIALTFGAQKINLHHYGNEFEPKASSALPGSLDLCFITDIQLEDAMSYVVSQGVEIIDGPVERTGAQGKLLSFYFRDIDQNVIEVSNLCK